MTADERAALARAAAKAAATPAAAGFWGVGKLLAALALGGAAVAAGASLRCAPPAEVLPPTARLVTPPPGVPAPTTPTPTPPVPPPRDERPVVVPRRRPSPAVSAPPRDESLAAESAALLRARSLLSDDPAAALAALDAHAASFSRPQLADERDFMAVEALRALGRDAEAEARARALIARDPQGPYARWLRRDAAR
jgi:hypothetical protein